VVGISVGCPVEGIVAVTSGAGLLEPEFDVSVLEFEVGLTVGTVGIITTPGGGGGRDEGVGIDVGMAGILGCEVDESKGGTTGACVVGIAVGAAVTAGVGGFGIEAGVGGGGGGLWGGAALTHNVAKIINRIKPRNTAR
jgi:hypothetical protein